MLTIRAYILACVRAYAPHSVHIRAHSRALSVRHHSCRARHGARLVLTRQWSGVYRRRHQVSTTPMGVVAMIYTDPNLRPCGHTLREGGTGAECTVCLAADEREREGE